MGKNSKIEWCDHTWNPWIGCTKVSVGCDNCYMHRDQTRWGRDPTVIRRTKDKTFRSPLKWEEPSRIFVCSFSDFFHEDVPEEWRRDAWEIMFHARYEHTFLLLTKRPENIKSMLPVGYIEGQHRHWKHIWFGATVEDQETADSRIPFLLDFPAAVRFISCEPLLGNILINKGGYGSTGFWIDELDWVIAGGESGTNCREMKLSWARYIYDQCRDCGVPFFMKQMSGNTKALREAIPQDLMIREFPSD